MLSDVALVDFNLPAHPPLPGSSPAFYDHKGRPCFILQTPPESF